jgi:hypothetical protein
MDAGGVAELLLGWGLTLREHEVRRFAQDDNLWMAMVVVKREAVKSGKL